MINDVLLQVVDEETAKNRVFFVSAKEVLELRTRPVGGGIPEDRGMLDGWNTRLKEFEEFVTILIVLYFYLTCNSSINYLFFRVLYFQLIWTQRRQALIMTY